MLLKYKDRDETVQFKMAKWRLLNSPPPTDTETYTKYRIIPSERNPDTS